MLKRLQHQPSFVRQKLLFVSDKQRQHKLLHAETLMHFCSTSLCIFTDRISGRTFNLRVLGKHHSKEAWLANLFYYVSKYIVDI